MGRKITPTVIAEQAQDFLMRLNLFKSRGLDDPRLRKELADMFAKPLYIIFENSQLSVKVPSDWKKENITLISKKGRMEETQNYGLMSLISVPGKMVEQILLEDVLKHMRDKEVI